jgi:hypothetical protein
LISTVSTLRRAFLRGRSRRREVTGARSSAMRRERVLGLGLLCACLFSCAQANALDLNDTERLQVGIGDRLSVKRDGKWVPTVEQLDALGRSVDLLQIWLPKGWSPDRV